MKFLPRPGDAVRYSGPEPSLSGATGTVLRIVPEYPDPDQPWRRGPVDQWSIVVRFDRLPRFWPSLAREFSATMGHLEAHSIREARPLPRRRFSATRS